MSQISIKPFVDKHPNMGLEKYKQVLFEGTSHKLSIWLREYVSGSGVEVAVTGLNEMSPDVLALPEETKKAKIAAIRKIVSELEMILGSNQVDVKSKDFWKEVKTLRPDNNVFWNSIKIIPSNDDVFLDPANPEDIIRICAIEAGGFPEIAPSYEVAKTSQKKYRFYLDKHEETVKETTKSSIKEARAGLLLLTMYDENINKLRYVCKAIDANSTQYKKNTPNEVLFGNMDEYIKGGADKKIRTNADNFIKIAELDMATLMLRAIVKDATFHSFLTFRNGQIYESGTDSAMGSSILEVVEFLKNPLHDGIYQRLLKRVEPFWSN